MSDLPTLKSRIKPPPSCPVHGKPLRPYRSMGKLVWSCWCLGYQEMIYPRNWFGSKPQRSLCPGHAP